MPNLMETFYTCAGKAFVEEILRDDGEYCVRKSRQDAERKRLSAAFGESIASRVDDLLDEQAAIGELRECAYFRAGFRMALELTR